MNTDFSHAISRVIETFHGRPENLHLQKDRKVLNEGLQRLVRNHERELPAYRKHLQEMQQTFLFESVESNAWETRLIDEGPEGLSDEELVNLLLRPTSIERIARQIHELQPIYWCSRSRATSTEKEMAGKR